MKPQTEDSRPVLRFHIEPNAALQRIRRELAAKLEFARLMGRLEVASMNAEG